MKKILIVCSLFLGLVQCTKEDAAVTTVEFNATNVAGVYKITGATVVAAGIESDIYATQYPACNKDDNHVFTAAGNYTLTDIGLTCTPTTPTVNGTFTTASTPTKTITFNGRMYDVVSFTALTMVISYNTTINYLGNNISAVQKLTLTRQ